jgi:hypothetical protein
MPTDAPKVVTTISWPKVILTVVIITLVAGLISGGLFWYFYVRQSEEPTSTTTTKQTTASAKPATPSAQKDETVLLTVNHWGQTGTDGWEYRTFKISFPSEYYVVSDDMVSSYKSQGGMAPPVLILTTEKQALVKGSKDDENYLDINEIEESGRKCVLIWSTSGFNSIESWYSHTGKNYQVISENKTKEGKYEFLKRTALDKNRNIEVSQAFILFPNKISYFFNTCSTNSEKDLKVILQNFEVRGV